MVTNLHLIYLDYCLRCATKLNMVFGGKFVILIGDLFQLKPVKGEYVFHRNPLFTETNYFKVRLALEESVRHQDPEFSKYILMLRKGNLVERERKMLAAYFWDNCVKYIHPTAFQLYNTNQNISNAVEREIRTIK